MSNYADKLSKAMQITGLSVAEIIRRGGPSRPTIYRILNDPRYVPESYTQERLCSALNISLEWFALDKGPMIAEVNESSIPYKDDTLLLGQCFASVLEALDQRSAPRPSPTKVGAVMAEVYALCLREGKTPTPDLVAPFIRVLLA